MSDTHAHGIPSPWRPPQRVRPLAIGLIRRGDTLLVMSVHNDAGAVIGYRPVGGEIAFGERADTALIREIREEIGADAEIGRQVATFENLFRHEGQSGHEIVFVFEARLTSLADMEDTPIWIEEGGGAFLLWMPVSDLLADGLLLPQSLAPLLTTD
ncbi:MAG: NUDIX domain-containing protein [Pseudomonadota bacterium]